MPIAPTLAWHPLQLMENAGAALAREVRARTPGKRIAIVAGRGNNGGDAFVAARHLADFRVATYLLGRSRDITTQEARQGWQILKTLDFDLIEVVDLWDFDLILGAIFGTGVRAVITGLEAAAIDAINSAGKPILSVDVPGGLGTNKVVRVADSVVTFHWPKLGMIGEVVVADIGIPPAAEFFAGPGDRQLLSFILTDISIHSPSTLLFLSPASFAASPLPSTRATASMASRYRTIWSSQLIRSPW